MLLNLKERIFQMNSIICTAILNVLPLSRSDIANIHIYTSKDIFHYNQDLIFKHLTYHVTYDIIKVLIHVHQLHQLQPSTFLGIKIALDIFFTYMVYTYS